MSTNPRSKAEICKNVDEFKDRCGRAGLITDKGQVDLKFVLEYLPELFDGWYFVPVATEEMKKGCLGLTLPEFKRIELREDVYEGLCNGEREHYFTGAHELGHMVLHGNLMLARTERQRDSVSLASGYEREADEFAKQLLGYDSKAAYHAAAELQKALVRWLGGGR